MSGVRPNSSLKDFLNTLIARRAILIIAVLGTIVFFNALFNNFVIDDSSQIVDNLTVHSIKNIPAFFAGSTFYNSVSQNLAGVYYKPLLSTFFSLIYTLFGPSYFAFHLFQIILHIANAAILFLFFKHFFSKPISLILALAFLVHPINSEAVFYISNTQEVLFFFFGILALWILVNFQPKKYFVLVPLCLFLSLLSKETGILFLGISIIYIFIMNKKYLYKLLGFSASALILYFLLRLNAIGLFIKAAGAPIGKLDLFGRILNMPAILFFYLKNFIFPLHLASSYQWAYTQLTFAHFPPPLIIDILFIVLALYFALILYKKYSRKYFRIYTFFGLWFLLGVLLHLQIIPLDATVAERWFYFPIVGLLGMIGVLLEAFHFNLSSKWGFAVVVAILLLLSARTLVRSFDWRDEFRLATHDIRVSKDSYSLENRISFELAKQGRFEEAKTHAERSISIYPYLTNYNTLGSIYLNLGDYQKAKETYLKALRFGDYYAVYENLGLLASVYGDPNENKEFIKDSLKKFPQDAKLWLYLAILDYQMNNINEAKAAISQARMYSQSPSIVSVYNKIMNNQPLNLNIKFKIGE